MKNKDVVKYHVTVPYYYYETSTISVPNEIPKEDIENLILEAIRYEGIFTDHFQHSDEGINENQFEVNIISNQESPDSEVLGNILKIENGEPRLKHIYSKKINSSN